MTTRHHQTGLAVIALFKLVKGALVLLIGLGLLHDIAALYFSMIK